MAKSSATVELKVMAEATDAIRDVAKVEDSLGDLQKAAREVGQGATGIDQLASSMDDLSEATQGAEKAGSNLGEAFLAGAAGGAAVGALASLQETVVSGFRRIGELATDAFGKALEFNTGRIKLQAQLGISAQDAQKFGQLAGDLYSEAYGESIDQVNEALGLVTRTLHFNINTQQDDLKALTGDVLNLSQVFGVDLEKSVIAVGQLVKTGLAKNAKDAADLLTVGFQKAGQDADDLLDTLVEYPTNFRRLGLSGADALGLINQGLKAGARNSDQVADSLKEFSLRIVDGSKSTSDALKAIGLDAAEIPRAVARGGDQAREAFQRVVEALKKVEDPAKRLQDITALFGTPAEDMAAAWDQLDLTHAVEELGKVEGAAKTLGDTVAEDAASKWESFKRTIETNVVTFLANTVVPKIQELAPKLQEALSAFSGAWEAFKAGFTGEQPVTGSIQALTHMDTGQGAFQEFKDFGQQVRELSETWLPLFKQALSDASDQLDRLLKVVRDNHQSLLILLGIFKFLAEVQAGIVIHALELIGDAIQGVGNRIEDLNRIVLFLRLAWDENWAAMEANVRFAVDHILNPIRDLYNALGILQFYMSFVLRNAVAEAWNGIKNIITGVIRDITQPIRDLIELMRRVSTFSFPSVPSIGGNAVATTAGPAMMLAASTSASSSPTVINVTVSHTGLGVDSPALQRDLVRALRKFTQREGPLRVPVSA